MPATPTRIGFILEEYRKVVSEDADVRAAFGNSARESEDPVETFFDSTADAQIMADERQALLGVIGRRRFRAEMNGTDEMAAIDYTSGTIPNGWLTSDRHDVSRKVLIAEFGFDFAKQDSAAMVWG
ncbi:hypothetical protein SZ64_04315 [Erythrobacter sp. SG61-1L]|uniref:hypothetical protein n=1 Tax=Erythrobacter sp. SG61-1L TaxID=1603897 RepID=UPI0006C92062|nr:hypothetical protein [Erythrobacter sp. SG61-1L]KPL67396.1 hypothetical protein SZ64_04315 [Erythrobacter sp. SG61-1L]